MGCCPCFRETQRVSDCTSSHLQRQDLSPKPKITKAQPTPEQQGYKIEITLKEDTHRETQTYLKPTEQSPVDVQSSLDIAMSASHSNRSEDHNVAPQHLICPKMILLGHSSIRESILYRWEQANFKEEELFLKVDYDRLFKQV